MNDVALDHSDGSTSQPGSPARLPVDTRSREDLGSLEVADQVIEKIAGHAVTLVAGAAAAPRRVLGVNVGTAKPENAASVRADVNDGVATVHATIAVGWPRSVQAVADEVRRCIRTEVTSLTGVRVDHIDVEVASMTVPRWAEPRVS